MFEVDIDVFGVSDLLAFQFDVVFDPALLSVDSVAEGAFLPVGGTTFFVPGTIDNSGGEVAGTADTLVGPIPGETGGGVLATLKLTALATGTSQLSFANPIFLDSSLNDLTSSIDFQTALVTASPEPCAGKVVLLMGALIFFARKYSISRIAS
jgi:general secretion pathway protein D